MARPLMRHGIVDLEQLFLKAKDDMKALRALEDELKHRNVPRAVALLDKVQRSLRTAKSTSESAEANQPASKPVASGTNLQGALWSEETKRGPRIGVVTNVSPPAKPPIEAVQTAQPVGPSASQAQHTNPVEIVSTMSTEEAYKVLKAIPGSTWEAIEQRRREAVQLAHPEKLTGLSPERRIQAQADAKRANVAYAVLLQTRTS